MLNGFIMPEKARITKVIINGVEIKIDPPIEIEAGNIIRIPYESVEQKRATDGACPYCDVIEFYIGAGGRIYCAQCHQPRR
jgi:hypothetical protein